MMEMTIATIGRLMKSEPFLNPFVALEGHRLDRHASRTLDPFGHDLSSPAASPSRSPTSCRRALHLTGRISTLSSLFTTAIW